MHIVQQNRFSSLKFLCKYTNLQKGIDKVQNKKQQTLMRLRLDNPDFTLFELSQEMTKELGEEITKSNINHLFRAIHNMAEKYAEAAKQ